MRVLCAGDLHIGRRSSKVPSDLDGPSFSCAAAWSAIVDLAIAERVDLVALSGDLVDRENRYFEAIGPLERGFRRLDTAGIETVVVTGNHDFDVLPRLVEDLASPHLHLLGRGGTWERFTLRRDGNPVLHVDGRSFAQESEYANPLDGYRSAPDGVPVLGLLHADLDQPQSPYGPVALADLRRQPVACWLLGHIHRPWLFAEPGGPPVLYPGSPQAMDPGETGTHGAWIVDIRDGGDLRERLVPLSTIRYETVQVDLSGVDTDDAFEGAIVQALRDLLTRVTADHSPLRCLSCRIVLTGRTALHRKLPALASTAESDLALPINEVHGVIEKIIVDTRPAINLDQVATRNDPPGEVARMILAFERDDDAPGYRELIATTAERLRSIHTYRGFLGVAADDAPGLNEARAYLLQEAWSLLDSLVAQKEGA